LASITHSPLLEHIGRVGQVIYRSSGRAINTSVQSGDHNSDSITALRGSGPGGSSPRLLAEHQAQSSLAQDWLG